LQDKKNYKYYSGITSQVNFCSIPLRLDAYNKCDFGCGYCFAKTRQGHGRKESAQIANPNQLLKKLSRIQVGPIKSALDEFIANRIPFQLGGMSDPFTKFEKENQVTLEYISILKKFNYPFLISTKSTLVSSPEYLEALNGANCYIRFSTTVIDEKERKKIDQGGSSYFDICKSAKKLSNLGIPVSFRFQPIIPGHENFSKKMIEQASSSGAKHISLEFLKVPIDANKKFAPNLKKLLSGNPIDEYKYLGAELKGREYILPLQYRSKHLLAMYQSIKEKDMTVGFADNDLLIHSDGKTCCSAADLYLKNANFFLSNVIGVTKNKKIPLSIKLSEIFNHWHPENSVTNYLNSKSRIGFKCVGQPDWKSYYSRVWNGHSGLYSPDFFDGIIRTNKKDEDGNIIYARTQSDFERGLSEIKRKIRNTPQS
jgi:DNA repair photolyase